MQHDKKTPSLSNQQRFDAILDAESVISATEATGAVPAAPKSKAEIDAYASLLDAVVTPDSPNKNQPSPPTSS